MPAEEPAVWHLKFIVADSEAELSYQHLLKTFQADEHVERVEVSTDSLDPEARTLIIWFQAGKTEPLNQALHRYDKIHRETPLHPKSRYERLLEETDIFDG